VEVTPDNFGRIAAQTAKQVIIQKLRDAEANVVFNEYKDKVFQIITGIVRQQERKNVVIDLGRGEAILPPREQVENEEYRAGDRLKLLVIEVSKGGQNPEIIVSRSHPIFVKKMFEIEVPEIADQTVEIKGIAREAGYRTKIAVFSKDPKVDCVGACVGMRGARVKNIVQELNGEKIDIVPWSADIQTYCRNALNPAKVRQIVSNEAEKQLLVYVDKGQFSLAIGKRGNNVRLTSKLLGWRVDIEAIEKDILPVAPTPADGESAENAVPVDPLNVSIDSVEGLSKKVKEFLVEAGYSSLAQLKNIKLNELYVIPGVGKTGAEEIMEHIQKAIHLHNT
jgi:N utilization substance protein A